MFFNMCLSWCELHCIYVWSVHLSCIPRSLRYRNAPSDLTLASPLYNSMRFRMRHGAGNGVYIENSDFFAAEGSERLPGLTAQKILVLLQGVSDSKQWRSGSFGVCTVSALRSMVHRSCLHHCLVVHPARQSCRKSIYGRRRKEFDRESQSFVSFLGLIVNALIKECGKLFCSFRTQLNIRALKISRIWVLRRKRLSIGSFRMKSYQAQRELWGSEISFDATSFSSLGKFWGTKSPLLRNELASLRKSGLYLVLLMKWKILLDCKLPSA